jgi:hypothetical protein
MQSKETFMHTDNTSFALALADDMIATRFTVVYGTTNLSQYLDLIDARSTAHLCAGLSDRVRRTAGMQRRKARLSIAGGGTVIIAIPMNDARTNKTIWATMDFHTWINMIEIGADGALSFDRKSTERNDGQVRVNMPMRSMTTGTKATAARIIANAKPGQQARMLDRNPLNLRNDNIYVVGNPAGIEGWAGTAKTDTRSQVGAQAEYRASLAGKDFDWKVNP